MYKLSFAFIFLIAVSCSNEHKEPDKSIAELEHELDSLKKEKEIIDAIASMDTIKTRFPSDEDPIIRIREKNK